MLSSGRVHALAAGLGWQQPLEQLRRLLLPAIWPWCQHVDITPRGGCWR